LKEIVIVHGTGGNPDENWFPWLAERVREGGHRAVVPTFPTPDGQDPESWLRVLDESVGDLSAETVLVGHSLGVAFLLRALERSDTQVAGTLLASGFIGELGLDEFDPLNAPFFEQEFNWEAIRNASEMFRLYNGADDPYVPLSKGEELAALLGVEMTVIDGGGHLNTSSGYTKFELLLKEMEPLLET
jgi:uncharacterized protein